MPNLKIIATSLFLMITSLTQAQGFECYNQSDGLISNDLESIAFDNNGNLLILYNFKRDLSILDIETDSITNLYFDSLSTGLVRNVVVDQQNNYYIGLSGSQGQVLKYNGQTFSSITQENSGIASNFITSVDLDQDNNLWLSTGSGVSMVSQDTVINYTKADGLKADYVQAIDCKADGNCYVFYSISSDFGYSVIKNDSIYTVSKPDIPYNQVAGIEFGNKFDVWYRIVRLAQIGSLGIVRIDNNGATNFQDADGLEHNTVRDLMYDERDKSLWIATIKGLNKFRNDSILQFDSMNTNISSFAKHPTTGDIWFATNMGVCHFRSKNTGGGASIDVIAKHIDIAVIENQLFIEAETTPSSITIHTTNGNIITSLPTYLGAINLTELSKGVYVLRCEVNGQPVIQKFVLH